MATKNLKVLMSGDTKPYREEINKAAVVTANFKKSAGDSMNELAEVFGAQAGEIKEHLKSFSDGFKSLLTSMKTLAGGATTFSGAMKLVKFAIAGTGIGLLIIAVASLVSYFTKTERGAEFVERAMAGLKAAFKVLIDRASAFGEGLFKIFSGKYEEGWNALKNSVKGVGTEMVEEAKAASVLEGRLQTLEDAEKQLELVNSERRANARELFAQSKEEGTTAENKKKLIHEAMALEKLAFNDEKVIAKERLDIHTKQVALGEARDEQNYKTLELQGAINNLSRDAANAEMSYSKALKSANKEIAANAEALIKKAEAQRKVDSEGMEPMKVKGVIVESKVKTSGDLVNVPKYKAQANAAMAVSDKLKKHLTQNLVDISTVVGDTAIGFGEFLGNLANGPDSIGSFADFISGQIANLMKTVGKQMIAFGVAGIALKGLLKNPWATVAAGVALVALGTIVQNSIGNSIASGGGNSGGAQNFNFDTRGPIAQTKAQNINVTVAGEFQLKNNVLVAGINKENTRVAIST